MVHERGTVSEVCLSLPYKRMRITTDFITDQITYQILSIHLSRCTKLSHANLSTPSP